MSLANQITNNENLAIEETRHQKTSREPASFAPQVAPPRGVLEADRNPTSFFHQRIAPPEHLALWVAHYWYVQWDLRGLPGSLAETLPHPSCYLVFEHDLQKPPDDPSVQQKAELSGVATGKFSRMMEGHGRVFGLKFRPGGLTPFLDAPVSTLTDRVIPASAVFDDSIHTLASELRECTTPEAMADAMTRYFEPRLPALDQEAELAATLVDLILHDPTILTVETLAHRFHRNVRSLQRLFRRYVGVSPKWVIRRYRLHELLERLHADQPLEFAQLALELGYSDQAHLIRDFRDLAGYTPTEYLKRKNES